MQRRLFLMALLLVSLAGCDLLEDITGVEEENATFELTAAALTGKIIAFSNPSPNTSIGELPEWDYSFGTTQAVACNPERDFTSDGWEVINDRTIRVYFGAQYEQYELVSMEGSLDSGNLDGQFRLTSSVAGNVVNGTFEQRGSFRWGTCG